MHNIPQGYYHIMHSTNNSKFRAQYEYRQIARIIERALVYHQIAKIMQILGAHFFNVNTLKTSNSVTCSTLTSQLTCASASEG